MEFIELAKKRYSVRSYENQSVSDEILKFIVESGRIAPTAANRQCQKILVLKTKESLTKLAKGANVFNAPVAFIVCGDADTVWVRSYDGHNTIDIDCSIVTDHMMHMATSLGLGSLWMTRFDPEIIRQEFNIPKNIIPVNILLVGYASGKVESPDRHATTRKPINEIIVNESF